MLAIIYLILMVALGDVICSRFYRFLSLPHRLAAAFLGGLIISSWFTYLASLAFAGTASPLLWGNLLFFAAAAAVIYWFRRRARVEQQGAMTPEPRAPGSNRWDWACITLFVVVSWWMMASSFNMEAGKLQIANHEWSDFGPNVAIMQSFALGHNFPTEYPHFSGDRIRYHFLFYFQAGNLEYLGLTPASSNNLLSVLSLVSMLILVMTLGELLFRSRVVGRLGAALFFFHGSLSYLSFLRSQGSVSKAVSATTRLQGFLPSGFPYRGEDWGVWSLVNFVNQRHFASAIGVLLLALIFIVGRYQNSLAAKSAALTSEEPPETLAESNSAESETSSFTKSWKARLFRWPMTGMTAAPLNNIAGFLFTGALLGLLPLWNGAVFIAAAALLGILFLLFPWRREMLALGLTRLCWRCHR